MPGSHSAGHRMERINAQLQQELALALARDVKDPRVQLVTVVSVACSPDLSYARVRVSSLGEAAQQTQTLRALRSMVGFLRHLLGERLDNLRRIPRLDFQLDQSIAYGVRVGTMLRELEAQGQDGSDD